MRQDTNPMHQTIVFLTLDDPGDYVMDDDLALPDLGALGWRVEMRSWRADRGREDRPARLAVVRSTWDYHRHPLAFLQAMAALEAEGTRLENPLSLLRWNVDKRYLRELGDRGIPIVHTRWLERGLEAGDLEAASDAFPAGEVVAKPLVGASAEDTLRIPRSRIPELEPGALRLFRGRPLQLQPFVEAVVHEGEYSLMYFDGIFSHAILKTPAVGDFRVQEEHGSRIVPILPGVDLLEASGRVIEAIPHGDAPLYARVDLVRWAGGWALMELELVEPSMYLRMDPGAPRRFAAAIDARARSNPG